MPINLRDCVSGRPWPTARAGILDYQVAGRLHFLIFRWHYVNTNRSNDSAEGYEGGRCSTHNRVHTQSFVSLCVTAYPLSDSAKCRCKGSYSSCFSFIVVHSPTHICSTLSICLLLVLLRNSFGSRGSTSFRQSDLPLAVQLCSPRPHTAHPSTLPSHPDAKMQR